MISIEDLLPHTLLESEQYSTVANIVMTINNDIKEMISVFPELVHISNAPEIFLPKLAALVRYEGRYDIDDESLRDIISRIITVYRDRGTDYSIIMAATYGDEPEWVGSSLFYTSHRSKELATIVYPITRLFRHSISRHSGTHYFPDNERWRDGTLIISAPYINDKLRNAVKKVVPAGLRVFWEVKSEISDSTGELITFGEYLVNAWYDLEYYLRIKDKSVNNTYFSTSSAYSGSSYLSGRQILYKYYDLEYFTGTSFIGEYQDSRHIVNEVNGKHISVDYAKYYKGLSKRSSNATRSGKFAFDGTYIGVYYAYAQDEQITPDDRYYSIKEVVNKPISGYVKDYCKPVEVTITKK